MIFLKQVNGDGETYPLGFLLGNWAASFSANIMTAILTEEPVSGRENHKIAWHEIFFGENLSRREKTITVDTLGLKGETTDSWASWLGGGFLRLGSRRPTKGFASIAGWF